MLVINLKILNGILSEVINKSKNTETLDILHNLRMYASQKDLVWRSMNKFKLMGERISEIMWELQEETFFP